MALELQVRAGQKFYDTGIDQIEKIYRVIFPLYRLFKQVCQTNNFADLAKKSFYDQAHPYIKMVSKNIEEQMKGSIA